MINIRNAILFSITYISALSLNNKIYFRNQLSSSAGINKGSIYIGELSLSTEFSNENYFKVALDSSFKHESNTTEGVDIHLSVMPVFYFSFLDIGIAPFQNYEEFLPYYEKEHMLVFSEQNWNFNLSLFINPKFDFDYLNNKCHFSLLTSFIKKNSKEMEILIYEPSIKISNIADKWENDLSFTLGRREKFTTIKSLVDAKDYFDLLDSFRIKDTLYSRDYFNLKLKHSFMVNKTDDSNFVSLFIREEMLYYRNSNESIHSTSIAGEVGLESKTDLPRGGFLDCKFAITFVHQMHTGENNIFFTLEKVIGIK